MTLIQKLREKRAKLIKRAREIHEAAEAEDREFTDEERGNYTEAMADANKLNDRIEREERQLTLAAEQRDLDASTGSARDGDDAGAGGDGEGGDGEGGRELRRRERPGYIGAFETYLSRGLRAFGAAEHRAIQADDDVSGGFMVASEQFSGNMIQAVDDMVHIRQVSHVEPPVTAAQSLGVVSMDTDIEDYEWTAEVSTAPEDTSLGFGKRAFMPNPLAKLIKISQKLLRLTSGGASALVLQRLAYKIGVTQEKAFQTGTGAGEPLGVFVASDSGVPTSRDMATGNTSSAIVADNLRRQKLNLKEGHRRLAKWLFHRDAILMIALLKDDYGRYMWTEGMREGEPDRLCGLPVMESEFAPNTFTTGLYVGILANWEYYWIVDALTFAVQRLDELFAATNQVGFIGRMESDGMPVLAEAFSRVKLG